MLLPRGAASMPAAAPASRRGAGLRLPCRPEPRRLRPQRRHANRASARRDVPLFRPLPRSSSGSRRSGGLRAALAAAASRAGAGDAGPQLPSGGAGLGLVHGVVRVTRAAGPGPCLCGGGDRPGGKPDPELQIPGDDPAGP